MKIEIDFSKVLSKSGKLRPDLDARLGSDSFLQNHANLGLGATRVVRRAQLERTVNCIGKIANCNGRHESTPTYFDYNDSIMQ